MEALVRKASELVANLGVYGVVWLDINLVAEHRYGRLVEFVELGKPITDSVLPLIGLEDEILALRKTPDRLLELPAVAVMNADGEGKKLNFTFLWIVEDNRPLLLTYRSNSQTELELELSQQIRARLMAEAAVTAKSNELARVNADLESYASIVSHDLKAPLRHMRYIADELISEAADTGDGTFTQKLAEIQSLSRRMSHMLTELLDYASLGRKYEGIAETDTRAMVETIAASLAERGAQILVTGTWPVTATLAAPLDLVLRNLIQNAKQHHDRPHGTIEVSCKDEYDALHISVSDDGPGIDPAHHDAVFLPFRTLSEAGGTGLGLAMVKKMTETVGGSIKLTSEPATRRGSTFHVFWPKRIGASQAGDGVATIGG